MRFYKQERTKCVCKSVCKTSKSLIFNQYCGDGRFEVELNKLYGGIMTQFRNEFHNLLDETDIRFFSCVVARFDAAIILRIFNLPSKSAVYMKKNRIKEKIRKSEAPNKDKFLLF